MALRRRVDGRNFALVLSSPLSRAWETCRITGYGDIARAEDALREWEYGVCEGRTTAEIQRKTPGWTIWDGEVPGGRVVSWGSLAEKIFREGFNRPLPESAPRVLRAPP
jgi:broad specificity phosphatase PhoE